MPSLRIERSGGGITNSKASRPGTSASKPTVDLPKIQTKADESQRPTTSWRPSRISPKTEGPLRASRPATSQEIRENDNVPSHRPDSTRLELRQERLSSRHEERVHADTLVPGAMDVDQRPDTASSIASSVLHHMVIEFQKSFQNKNAPKFAKLADVFRDTDINKSGRIGRDEMMQAMRRLEIPVDERVIDEIMSRCENPEAGMNLNDFRNNLWVDDRMDVMIDERKNKRAGSHGDNAGAKHLWTRTGPAGRCVGTLNDTLEVDRIAAGQIPPRLNSNFSSVRYNIVTFDRREPPVHPRVAVPLHHRPSLFDPPPPGGRRVAYDHGDTPYNVVTLRTPRPALEGADPLPAFQVPVRLVTFARLNRGEYPTQRGLFLSKTFV